ncbi:MAG: hypothetical protein LBS94_01860 [Prevotellaceae bacterium]|jgi:hypothetical protein|nr:hypothetical protein [Prevotellaceae bacterium]
MKKILIIAAAAIGLASCAEEAITFPESLMIEETELTLVAEGETYMNRFYTTADIGSVVIEVPEADRQWLSVSIVDKQLKIEAATNASISPRSTSFVVKTAMRSVTISVAQTGLPTRKLTIVGGTFSSAQDASGDGPFTFSYDGNYDTYWHSSYSNAVYGQRQYENHWLQYDLEPGTPSLDLIMVYGRKHTAAANGRWGLFRIYVKGDGTDVARTDLTDAGIDTAWREADGVTVLQIGSVDAEGYMLLCKGDETPYATINGQHIVSLELPISVANPTAVKVIINGEIAQRGVNLGGSRSGHGSLGEIEFYGKVN